MARSIYVGTSIEALVHGLTVVTRNVGDFEGTGVVVVDPSQGVGRISEA